jgi:DTW domain-containing protein YfiP
MTKRILCCNCQRPEKSCICAFITPIENDTHVVVLQHPSEKSQSKGTVDLLDKSLRSCQIIIDEDFTNNKHLIQVIERYQSVLLYPSEKAQELVVSLEELVLGNGVKTECVNKKSNEQTKPYCLIILDGTWKKAYKMFMLCQQLQILPQVCLPESFSNAGQYHIRKVDKKNALSSLEACCYALSLLEGMDKYQMLLAKFEAFNQLQLSFRPKQHLSPAQTHFLGKK